MSDAFTWPDVSPPGSEEERDSAWDAAIQSAHDYGWPEEQIEAVLISRRVSYAERVASVELISELKRTGRWREALLEEKRTQLRDPGRPMDGRPWWKQF